MKSEVDECECVSPLQITIWLNALNDQIIKCDGMIEDLGVRLESVQTPEVPSTAEDKTKEAENLSPIAKILRAYCQRVETITNTLKKYLQRLEI